jgi:hypothetical protein
MVGEMMQAALATGAREDELAKCPKLATARCIALSRKCSAS